jgi:hypothetical protein
MDQKIQVRKTLQNSLNLWHKNIYVKFGKFMAQKYLCQISANLWHKNIYVKFRQIYVKIVALANILETNITKF